MSVRTSSKGRPRTGGGTLVIVLSRAIGRDTLPAAKKWASSDWSAVKQVGTVDAIWTLCASSRSSTIIKDATLRPTPAAGPPLRIFWQKTGCPSERWRFGLLTTGGGSRHVERARSRSGSPLGNDNLTTSKDVQMPELYGLKGADRIRERERGRPAAIRSSPWTAHA